MLLSNPAGHVPRWPVFRSCRNDCLLWTSRACATTGGPGGEKDWVGEPTFPQDERISPLEAIKAITINAAYQYFEEAEKGSIEPGKLADLVILDRNPLKVEPDAIRDIKVAETIKAGKTIYIKTGVGVHFPGETDAGP